MKKEGKKRWLEISISVALPLLVILAVAAEHCGWIDRWRGLDRVEEVSDRFDHPDSSAGIEWVHSNDVEWKPTIALIKNYSKVKLREDKPALAIARKQTFAWTREGDFDKSVSPSTPIYVLYETRIGEGIPKNKDDYSIVGTIGDFHRWIDRSKTSCHFFINDLLLALMPIILSFWLWRINYSQHRRSAHP